MFTLEDKNALDNKIKNCNFDDVISQRNDIVGYLDNCVFDLISSKESFKAFYNYNPEELFKKIKVAEFMKSFINSVYIEEHDEEDVHDYLKELNHTNFQYGLEKIIFLENYLKKYNMNMEQYKQNIIDIIVESNISTPFSYIVRKYDVQFNTNHLIESITGFPDIYKHIKEKVINNQEDWIKVKNPNNGNNVLHEVFSNSTIGFTLHLHMKEIYSSMSEDNFILLCNETNTKGNTPFMELSQHLYKKIQNGDARHTGLSDAFAYSVQECIEFIISIPKINSSIFETNLEGFNIYNAFKDKSIYVNEEKSNTLFSLINKMIIEQEADILNKSFHRKTNNKKSLSRI